MKNLQKMGGIAALFAAAAFVFGFVGYLLVVDISSAVDPVEKVALLADNQTFLYILNLIVYVVWAVFLVVLTLALYERLKAGEPALAQTSTVIGLIWACVIIASGIVANYGMGIVVDLYSTDPAQAATVWLPIESVSDGLGGGGGEFLGGLWMALVSWAALRAGEFPRRLNYLGLVIGVAGLLSNIPALREVGAIFFGLGQIVWFIWLGIVMLRRIPSTVPAEEPDTFVPGHGTT